MNLSGAGVEFLKSFEGCVLHVYPDSHGNPTAGWGHLLRPGESFPNGLSQNEADDLFSSDVELVAEHPISKLVHVELNQNQYDALVSMIFNTGSGPLVQTLGKVLNAGKYDCVPEQMLRWCHADGQVDPELLARRHREALLWSRPVE